MSVARVMVLGGGGMLGHVCRIRLAELGHNVVAVGRSASPDWIQVDVADTDALLARIRQEKPDFVVNCVGILVKDADEDRVRAIRLNALLPHVLAAAPPVHRFRLITVSSDCIFSGRAGRYPEDARPDADTIYGRTKSLGEVENGHDLTFRTSIVGPELRPQGIGLFNWFMHQKGTVQGYAKHIWGGVTTLEVAKAVDFVTGHPTTGLVHLTNGEPIAKYDLLKLFAEVWEKRDVQIVPSDASVCDRSIVCTRKDFAYHVPSYRDMLLEMRAFMEAHAALYKHYA
jgi:dTDP-4-dehydrorhamnose reductase